MSYTPPQGYKGSALPASVHSVLEQVERLGIRAEASVQAAGKTLILEQDGIRCGYINSSVLGRNGVLGYQFTEWWGAPPSGACPPKMADKLVSTFCNRYKCGAGDFVIMPGGGSNQGRTFLIIKNPTVAVRVLIQDYGHTSGETVENTEVSERFVYVEGALRDVLMQRSERSSAAREACLSHYGYDCYVCGLNLQRRYRGLPAPLIHVHHEEPLATHPGSREVDPIEDLKPVCPNCHAVIHSRTPPYSIAEMRQMARDES